MDGPQPQTALVTGAARRVGRALALDLAAHGWAVAVHYRNSDEEARGVVGKIEAAGGRAVALAADLADEQQTAGLIGRAGDALGTITCLINNASIFEPDGPLMATRQSWDAHMETNLRAPFVLTQALAGQLPTGTKGNVINLIDQRVWNLTPFFTTYTLSKAGLWTLTQTLAMGLAPDIRVNAIGPGPTLPSTRQSEAQFAAQAASTPLGRKVEMDEICRGVRFILAASALTGQMIALDSGQHLGWAQPDTTRIPGE